MISFVTVEGEDIIVTLHPAAHEKVNLAAVFPYARMNAGWFLAADEQKNRTFSWKGLEELLLLWSDCWLEVVSHRFLKNCFKKNDPPLNVIHQLWALSLPDIDCFFVCKCQDSYLYYLETALAKTILRSLTCLFPLQWAILKNRDKKLINIHRESL